jgi:four helix bundle protein
VIGDRLLVIGGKLSVMESNAMQQAESFRDSVVYQKAREVSRRFFDLSKSFPSEERYSLTDQGRRSSRSIGAQIAEAWAKRSYAKHFVSKLTDADGEQQETQHWVDTALDCGYLPPQTRDELVDELERIGRMLQSMIDKADLFCGSSAHCVREATVDYFVS